jgi:hypothetical protein
MYGGEGGIRTHVDLRPNGFQDRPVMTTSVPLRMDSNKIDCTTGQNRYATLLSLRPQFFFLSVS